MSAAIANLPTAAAPGSGVIQTVPASTRVSRAIVPGTMDEALRYAKVLSASGLLPKSFYASGDPTAAAFCAIQLGAEVGLSPMASVQNIAIINNKPGLYGPAQLAVVEASGLLEDFDEGVRGEGDAREGFCFVKRVGRRPKTVSFSMADAKRAKLVGKSGPWQEYPDRMLMARARTFALRDAFPDILLGLGYSVEELQDIPRIVDAVPDPEPPKDPPKAETPAVSVTSTVTPSPKPPLMVAIGEGWDPVQFPRGKKGLREAMEFMVGAVCDGKPQVVALNCELLDQIAEHIPELADEVAELRSAAAEALAPKDEPDNFVQEFLGEDDTFPGDRPLTDS